MIHVNIPFDSNGNLGAAYNRFVEYIPRGDWACFIDHDAMFTTNDWFTRIERVIAENPQVGAFGCRTNRVGHTHQLIGGVDIDSHDIRYHRDIGKRIAEKYDTDAAPIGGFRSEAQIRSNNAYRQSIGKPDVFYNWGFSGVFILVKKEIWQAIGGFKDGFLEVDMDFSTKVHQHNIPFYIMNGLYVYHWYRADDPYQRTSGQLDKIRKNFSNTDFDLDKLYLMD